ncbi:hypothetical protein ACH5RR_003169 [Cinchona calisaya]|uniref:Uncharacterized protein n=1 Tax=Cinchona calisaya TaxID=153742 RepID=A0ABD3AUE7_9GENT
MKIMNGHGCVQKNTWTRFQPYVIKGNCDLEIKLQFGYIQTLNRGQDTLTKVNDSPGSNRMQYGSSWGPTVSCTNVSSIKRVHVGNMAPIACNIAQVSDQRFLALSASFIKRVHLGNTPIACNMVQVGDQRFPALSASSIQMAYLENLAPIVCNRVQVGDQRFLGLSASSIKRARSGNISRPLGNISRPSGHIHTVLPFKKVPYSKSAIPIGRGPYPTSAPFERRDLNRKGAYPNRGSIPPNVEFYEKRIPHQKNGCPS